MENGAGSGNCELRRAQKNEGDSVLAASPSFRLMREVLASRCRLAEDGSVLPWPPSARAASRSLPFGAPHGYDPVLPASHL